MTINENDWIDASGNLHKKNEKEIIYNEGVIPDRLFQIYMTKNKQRVQGSISDSLSTLSPSESNQYEKEYQTLIDPENKDAKVPNWAQKIREMPQDDTGRQLYYAIRHNTEMFSRSNKTYTNVVKPVVNAETKKETNQILPNVETESVNDAGYAYTFHPLATSKKVDDVGVAINSKTKKEEDLSGKGGFVVGITKNGLANISTKEAKPEMKGDKYILRSPTGKQIPNETIVNDHGTDKTMAEVESELHNQENPEEYLNGVRGYGVDKAGKKVLGGNVKFNKKSEGEIYFAPATKFFSKEVLSDPKFGIDIKEGSNLNATFNELIPKAKETSKGKESNINEQPKEITATQDQLDAQAKKKGMTSEKYLEFVKKQGFKVTIQ
jgi:hypothetical protein